MDGESFPARSMRTPGAREGLPCPVGRVHYPASPDAVTCYTVTADGGFQPERLRRSWLNTSQGKEGTMPKRHTRKARP